jgi:putative permease
MTQLPDPRLRQDLAKVVFLFVALAGMAGVFILSPALSTPTMLSIVISMLLSPAVSAIERRGYSRTVAIVFVFGVIAAVLGGLATWAAASLSAEWQSFRDKAPERFQMAIHEMRALEQSFKARHPFLDSIHPVDAIVAWGQDTGRWFADQGASLAASLLTWLLIVPPLTFVMLNDGRNMRRRFFDLVPNRYFESYFSVSSKITTAISDYLRAKLIEAALVGLLTTAGLLAIHAPYAFVLGAVSGLTNIVPYAGPVIGIAPALLVTLFDHSNSGLLVPMLAVYGVANLIDMAVIFPVVVAKLVNLHPLLLIAVVAIGQKYYGLVGMLISIPVATACKVVFTEIHFAIYQPRRSRWVEDHMAELDENFEEVA